MAEERPQPQPPNSRREAAAQLASSDPPSMDIEQLAAEEERRGSEAGCRQPQAQENTPAEGGAVPAAGLAVFLQEGGRGSLRADEQEGGAEEDGSSRGGRERSASVRRVGFLSPRAAAAEGAAGSHAGHQGGEAAGRDEASPVQRVSLVSPFASCTDEAYPGAALPLLKPRPAL